MDNVMKFKVKEIAMASGVDEATLFYRLKKCVERGEIPEGTRTLNYEQVKLLLRKRRNGRPGADPAKVSELKRWLATDCLPVKR